MGLRSFAEVIGMVQHIENEAFARLFMQNQHALLRFIRIMAPQLADAEDILQETAVALWQKAADYNPDLPFLPWAMQFARNKVYQHRRKNHNWLVLDNDVIETLMQEHEHVAPELESRRVFLASCLKKLPKQSARLLELRYFDRMQVPEIGVELKISVSTLYKIFYRIRAELMKCVSRSMLQEQTI